MASFEIKEKDFLVLMVAKVSMALIVGTTGLTSRSILAQAKLCHACHLCIYICRPRRCTPTCTTCCTRSTRSRSGPRCTFLALCTCICTRFDHSDNTIHPG